MSTEQDNTATAVTNTVTYKDTTYKVTIVVRHRDGLWVGRDDYDAFEAAVGPDLHSEWLGHFWTQNSDLWCTGNPPLN